MKLLNLGAIALLATIICSCKPKPIAGEVFSSSEHGNAPIGDVEVFLVNQKDIDAFIAERNSALKAKFDALKSFWENTKQQSTNFQAELHKAFQTSEDYKRGGYKTSPGYMSLEAEYADLEKTNSVLTTAIRTLEGRRSTGPYIGAVQGQQAQENNRVINQAIAIDRERLRDIREQEQAIERKMNAMRYSGAGSSVADPLTDLRANVVTSGKAELDARKSLQGFLKTMDFFDGLNIPETGATASDMSGKFSIKPNGQNQKVFGKWKDQMRNRNVYWVQDLPKQQGYKIVLTLRNAFAASFLDGQDVSAVAPDLDARPDL
jgi:hypothetical protein